MAETPDTDHFGFTRIGEGETMSKNGFAALDLDRVTLDDVLHALSQHNHDATPRLNNPTGAPSLVAQTSGGALPPGVTLYYRISYLDKWGLETAASSESAVSTSGTLSAPNPIAASLESTSGQLGAGQFSYAMTFTTAAGGETVPSSSTTIRIASGTTNRIRLDLPDLPPGAVSARIYRSRPGQTQFFFWREHTYTGATPTNVVYDAGNVNEDATITLPAFNSTNNTNSIEVTVPGATLPTGVFGWKLYRSLEPSTYTGFNLVHTVVESTTETSRDVRTTWIDTGTSLQLGEPRQVSSTISGGSLIDLSQVGGRLPLAAMARGSRSWDPFAPGALVMGREYARFTCPTVLEPIALSAYFLTKPTTVANGAQVGFRAVDKNGSFLELATYLSQEATPQNLNYVVRRLPITNALTVQAESGTRSATSPIVSDLTAQNGQAVEIDAVNELVQYNFGPLDKGRYQGFVRLRLLGSATTGPLTDILVQALVPGATPTPIASREYTITKQPNDAYYELLPVEFLAPGGVDVTLRVTKRLSDPAVYRIDQFRYTAEVTSLAAGEISLVATVCDLPDQNYTQAVPTGNTYWTFDKNSVVLSNIETSKTVRINTSDNASTSFTVTVNEPWVTVSPTSGTAASQLLTLTFDPATFNPGERKTATLSVSGATHTGTSITVVGLRAPTVTGSDVNVTLLY